MTEEQFLEIVSTALEVDATDITIDTKMYDIEAWDSLGQLSILIALDQSTSGQASSIPALGSMTTLADMFDVVKPL